MHHIKGFIVVGSAGFRKRLMSYMSNLSLCSNAQHLECLLVMLSSDKLDISWNWMQEFSGVTVCTINLLKFADIINSFHKHYKDISTIKSK